MSAPLAPAARPFEEFREQCRALLAPLIAEPIDLIFTTPPQPEYGDLSCNAAFLLAKLRRAAPPRIAGQLAEAIDSGGATLVRAVRAVGGYVNFYMDSPAFSAALVGAVEAAGDGFGHLRPATPRRVVVEHTSVNPNKEWHIGHARNAILGDVLARVLRAAGHTVEVQNYIDDTGKQVAEMVYALRHLGYLRPDGAVEVPAGKKFDHFVGEAYVDLNATLLEEQALRAEQAALDEAQALDDAAVASRRDNLQARLAAASDGHEEALERELRGWDAVALRPRAERAERRGQITLALEDLAAIKRGVEVVQHELEAGVHRDLVHRCLSAQVATAWRLGIYYDLMPWESDIVRAHLLSEAFELIRQSPEVYQPIEGRFAGCLMMRMGDFLGESGGPEDGEHSIDKVLIRSNGIPTYTGKDIAYHFWKYGLLTNDLAYREDTVQPNGQPLWTSAPDGQPRPAFAPTDVINVIANHQEYPQKVVAAALKVTGHEQQQRGFHHLSYGMVDILQEGVRVKQSGRKGTGLATDDVVDRATAVCYEISAAKWGAEASEEDLRQAAETLGTAAVRYVMCQFNPLKDIAFDITAVSRPEGNTGPYLQYAYTRTQSILRRARDERGIAAGEVAAGQIALLDQPAERALIIGLSHLPDVVHNVAETLAVNSLADYGYELATLFTQFYDRCPVLRAETPELVRARLRLVAATAQVMRNAYGLLGLGLRDRL